MNKELVMKTVRLILSAIAAVMIAAAGAAASATPSVINSELETRALSGELHDAFQAIADDADDPAWIGYAAPLIPGYEMCCGDYRQSHCLCKLERENNTYQHSGDADDKDLLVSRDMFVLFRIEDGEVERIRAYSENCELDAGGVPMYWLTGVSSTESIAFLKTFATSQGHSRKEREEIAQQAVSTIAMHHDPAALGVLEEFVEPGQPEKLREHTVFWIGNQGGARGIAILNRLLEEDPSSKVREQTVFALTLPDNPEAIESLIRVARHDRDAEIRSNALFWLANKAGERATEAIQDAIENDPDTDVKEQAVFALSQLPDDQGVPLLIKVASTNHNPEVRKQAIFWLGQSEDDRALEFFEEILSR